jgi:hypothetical protein
MKKTLTAICAAALLGTSCVGPYNAFNSVASWNSTSGKSAKWGANHRTILALLLALTTNKK